MTARAWHATADPIDYDDVDSSDDYMTPELLAGERIGEPLPRIGRRRLLRRSAAVAIVAGGGWAYLTDQVSVPPWLSAAISGAISAAMRPVPPVAERKAAEPVAPEAVAPLPTVEVAATPGTDPAAAPTAPAAADAAETAAAVAEPLPPPKADKADPYGQRAAAVGLHPDLSRVLLERMTADDYRNAAFAIKTALAETPDSAVYTWPKERAKEAALFEVRFVAGAAGGCRRYVVEVTKDGWLTTALPVEKCGKGLLGLTR